MKLFDIQLLTDQTGSAMTTAFHNQATALGISSSTLLAATFRFPSGVADLNTGIPYPFNKSGMIWQIGLKIGSNLIESLALPPGSSIANDVSVFATPISGWSLEPVFVSPTTGLMIVTLGI